MHFRDFHPSSRPPVSDRDLERYADRWIVVRGGKVVLEASSYDALIATLTSARRKEGDAILYLPPRDVVRERSHRDLVAR